MIKLTFPSVVLDEHIVFTADVNRIIVAFQRKGYSVEPEDAQEAWLCYSDEMMAGWLCMDGLTDEEIFENCRDFLE